MAGEQIVLDWMSEKQLELAALGETEMFSSKGRFFQSASAREMALDDGTVGYTQGHRIDDCLRRAVATVLQIPPRKIPDPLLHWRVTYGKQKLSYVSQQSWALLARWLRAQALQMRFHDEPPIACDRWIGVVDGTPGTPDHCVVMVRDSVLFDPAHGFPAPAGMRARRVRAEMVARGISIERSPADASD